MQVDRRARLRLRAQHALFVALWTALIVLAGWLAQEYRVEFDWTAGGRNTLSEVSRRILERLDGPVRITAYARPDEMLRKRIEDLIARYRRARADAVELEFVNPDREPERTRELGITFDGTLVLRYHGRMEKVTELTEQAVSTAIQRLLRAGERRLVFLAGHGERSPEGPANHDLGRFVENLKRRGIETATLNLAQTPEIPPDAGALVIASPATALLPGEARIVRAWVERGGNLLWLLDPGEGTAGLEPLLGLLGLEVLPGVVVDANAPLFGIRDPSFVVVAEYPRHPVTTALRLITLFPRAAALEARPTEGWHAAQVLRTLPRAWNETGPLEGEVRLDPDRGERAGPLTLAVALTRPRPAAGAGGKADGASTPGLDTARDGAGEDGPSAPAPTSGTAGGGASTGPERSAGQSRRDAARTQETTPASTDTAGPSAPAPASGTAGGEGEAAAGSEPRGEQRILVVGDGDFLANAYLGNGGNLDLGLAMVNWLLHDDALVQVPARAAPDRGLSLSRTAAAAIGIGFLLVLPFGLILTGVAIWWRRSRR